MHLHFIISTYQFLFIQFQRPHDRRQQHPGRAVLFQDQTSLTSGDNKVSSFYYMLGMFVHAWLWFSVEL